MSRVILNFTYGLTDPRFNGSSAVRYIGVTTDPNRRYREHLRCLASAPIEKNVWIRSLQADGLEPGIKIFEVFETQGTRDNVMIQAREHETRWIDRYMSLGADLLNRQIGNSNDPYDPIDWIDELLMAPGFDGLIVGGEPD